MMLINPGPASFMRLYENWTEDDKKNSRVGRAAWNAMQALQAVSKEEVERQSEVEAGNEDEDGDDAADAPANDNEHNDANLVDNDAFSATEYLIDLNALAQMGTNQAIFLDNKTSHAVSISTDQISQLRTAPNGGLVIPNGAPRGASRVKMLAPRARKSARAIVTTDDVPEPSCACGLSRYGVSARPILTMATKTVGAEHRCMGDLFEGVDVTHIVTDTIKSRLFKVKVSGGESSAEEKVEHGDNLKDTASKQL